MRTFKRTQKNVTSIRTFDGSTMTHKTYIDDVLTAHYSIFVPDDERLRMIGKMFRNGWKEVRENGNTAG